jgi:hypothetical protein
LNNTLNDATRKEFTVTSKFGYVRRIVNDGASEGHACERKTGSPL